MGNGFWSALARLLGLGQDPAQQPARTKQSPQNRPSTRSKATGTRTARTKTVDNRAADNSRPPRSEATPRPKPGPRPKAASNPAPRAATQEQHDYAGDFTGKAKLGYAPTPDGDPDPGEVVWAWVPFEEDHSQGKDRPVLVIALHRDKVLGLMLTSKDHDRDAAHEARYGRLWMDIGTGAWDRQNRPSEVRLDRVLQLEPGAVRREGAALSEPVYNQVAAAVREAKGW
ncbi:type II toxin-antitoxin system PemK/MazF family toxin [Kineosporia babensis]|uniref:Type II toxin-antitoxin system PemK/MazF family toxin n=1 Tax=Kineosporia babensis TaxID=499548 RepID=A0A9X1STW5_9ACTN|nr:type II toxin-antitoxin system PemK/MazF family toxin [Kineosporia babensis]MCD5311756.1 type II toxin-antitoxin system PemK/MazF family toxin [Kineosporia babensis]